MVFDVLKYLVAFEIVRTTHSLMQHHIPEGFIAQEHSCENCKSCMSIFCLYNDTVHNIMHKCEILI